MKSFKTYITEVAANTLANLSYASLGDPERADNGAGGGGGGGGNQNADFRGRGLDFKDNKGYKPWQTRNASEANERNENLKKWVQAAQQSGKKQ